MAKHFNLHNPNGFFDICNHRPHELLFLTICPPLGNVCKLYSLSKETQQLKNIYNMGVCTLQICCCKTKNTISKVSNIWIKLTFYICIGWICTLSLSVTPEIYTSPKPDSGGNYVFNTLIPQKWRLHFNTPNPQETPTPLFR